MRKMYFAMIPKRGFLESAVITVGVGAGLVYGAKLLLGDEKFNEYKDKARDVVFNSGAKEFDSRTEPAAQEFDDVTGANEEDDIVARIRKAAEKGVNKILK